MQSDSETFEKSVEGNHCAGVIFIKFFLLMVLPFFIILAPLIFHLMVLLL